MRAPPSGLCPHLCVLPDRASGRIVYSFSVPYLAACTGHCCCRNVYHHLLHMLSYGAPRLACADTCGFWHCATVHTELVVVCTGWKSWRLQAGQALDCRVRVALTSCLPLLANPRISHSLLLPRAHLCCFTCLLCLPRFAWLVCAATAAALEGW